MAGRRSPQKLAFGVPVDNDKALSLDIPEFAQATVNGFHLLPLFQAVRCGGNCSLR